MLFKEVVEYLLTGTGQEVEESLKMNLESKDWWRGEITLGGGDFREVMLEYTQDVEEEPEEGEELLALRLWFSPGMKESTLPGMDRTIFELGEDEELEAELDKVIAWLVAGALGRALEIQVEGLEENEVKGGMSKADTPAKVTHISSLGFTFYPARKIAKDVMRK